LRRSTRTGRVTTLSSIAVAYAAGPKYCVSFDDPEQVCERQRDTGSRGGFVFLVHTTRDDPDRVVGQRLGPVLETIENALRADQAKMIEAE
jgi:hypothetical protein